MPSDSVTVRASRCGPSLYAELIFAEWSVPAIGTQRSRGRLSRDAPPSLSRRRTMIVSLRWPLTSASSPIEAFSSSPMSTPSRRVRADDEEVLGRPVVGGEHLFEVGHPFDVLGALPGRVEDPGTARGADEHGQAEGQARRWAAQSASRHGRTNANGGRRCRFRGHPWLRRSAQVDHVADGDAVGDAHESTTTRRPSGSTSVAVPSITPSTNSILTRRPRVARVWR